MWGLGCLVGVSLFMVLYLVGWKVLELFISLLRGRVGLCMVGCLRQFEVKVVDFEETWL